MAELPPMMNPLEKKEPVIHVIPDEFYGAAAKAKLPPAQVAPPPAPVGKPVPAPVPATATSGGSAPVASAKGGSKAWILIPIIALLLLGGMGFGAWYFLLRKPVAAPPASKPAVTLPPVETTPTEPATNTAPEPTPTPAPAPEPATSTPVVAAPAVAVDSDNDGLTDVEETLYGTNPNKSDSDGDGYSDSVELINLYNPAGFKPNTALAAGLVTVYDSKDGGYQIDYPTPWTPSPQDAGGVSFGNAQNQPVSVSAQDNPDNTSVLDWFLKANPSVAPSDAQQFFTKSGAKGVHGPNPQVSYVAGKGKIYIISYTTGVTDPPYFLTTFKMMVNSFKVKP